jgi:hypothetical protein
MWISTASNPAVMPVYNSIEMDWNEIMTMESAPV